MLIVRTPVRISFGGGGTDLPAYYEKYGGGVLSTAINKYFYSVLCKRNDGKVQVISSDLRKVETWENLDAQELTDSSLEIPLSILKSSGTPISVDLFLASEIPPGTGLGSSASVCVNVMKCLATYRGQQLSKYELAEKSFEMARKTLRKSVGKQDEYAAAFGGLNYISFYSDGSTLVEPLQLPAVFLQSFQKHLMLYYTGAAHNSWEILREQEQRSSEPSGPSLDALHEIFELGKSMREALLDQDLHRFGSLLHEGWMAKKRISEKISNTGIDALYRLALEHGALGGKIAGAGGGGFLLLFCEPAKQPQLRQAFADIGFRPLEFAFDMAGAQVVVNDPFIDDDGQCGSRWRFISNAAPVEA